MDTNTAHITSIKALIRHLRKQYLPKGITFTLSGRYIRRRIYYINTLDYECNKDSTEKLNLKMLMILFLNELVSMAYHRCSPVGEVSEITQFLKKEF
jgi:hypothetical protein